MNDRWNRQLLPQVSKVLLVVLMDIFSTALAFFLGLWLRYDFTFGGIARYHLINYINTIGIWCAITVAVLAAFH